MSLEQLIAERSKLDDRHGDEPVRCKFLKSTLDALIFTKGGKPKPLVLIRDDGFEFRSVEEWKAFKFPQRPMRATPEPTIPCGGDDLTK